MRRSATLIHSPLLPLLLALPLALGASCGDDPQPDTADDAAVTDAAAPDDTATPNEDARPPAEVTLLGHCDRPDTGEDAEGGPLAARTVFSGRYQCAPPSAPDEHVVLTEAAWAPIAADLTRCSDAPAPGAIEFASEYAVVLGVSAFQTCGITLDDVSTSAGVASPHVEAAFTDRSAGCLTACAMGGAFVVVLAVPRAAGTDPTLCRRVHPGCDQP